MTPVVLSADDYGLHAGIDEAIITLAGLGRLTATSCLALSPRWREAAAALRPLSSNIDIGLHLDFTEFGAAHSWSGLAVSAYSQQLDEREIRKHIALQLDVFQDHLGVPPAYVDGHRHVHQLPQIRTALLDELERRNGSTRPWLRISLPPRDGTKAKIIGMLGAKGLVAEAQRKGFAHSARLLGVYGFDLSPEGYQRRMSHWLAAARGGDVLMMHPACAAPDNDPIGSARIAEHAYLAGDAFGALLMEHGILATRGSDLFGVP